MRTQSSPSPSGDGVRRSRPLPRPGRRPPREGAAAPSSSSSRPKKAAARRHRSNENAVGRSLLVLLLCCASPTPTAAAGPFAALRPFLPLPDDASPSFPSRELKKNTPSPTFPPTSSPETPSPETPSPETPSPTTSPVTPSPTSEPTIAPTESPLRSPPGQWTTIGSPGRPITDPPATAAPPRVERPRDDLPAPPASVPAPAPEKEVRDTVAVPFSSMTLSLRTAADAKRSEDGSDLEAFAAATVEYLDRDDRLERALEPLLSEKGGGAEYESADVFATEGVGNRGRLRRRRRRLAFEARRATDGGMEAIVLFGGVRFSTPRSDDPLASGVPDESSLTSVMLNVFVDGGRDPIFLEILRERAVSAGWLAGVEGYDVAIAGEGSGSTGGGGGQEKGSVSGSTGEIGADDGGEGDDGGGSVGSLRVADSSDANGDGGGGGPSSSTIFIVVGAVGGALSLCLLGGGLLYAKRRYEFDGENLKSAAAADGKTKKKGDALPPLPNLPPTMVSVEKRGKGGRPRPSSSKNARSPATVTGVSGSGAVGNGGKGVAFHGPVGGAAAAGGGAGLHCPQTPEHDDTGASLATASDDESDFFRARAALAASPASSQRGGSSLIGSVGHDTHLGDDTSYGYSVDGIESLAAPSKVSSGGGTIGRRYEAAAGATAAGFRDEKGGVFRWNEDGTKMVYTPAAPSPLASTLTPGGGGGAEGDERSASSSQNGFVYDETREKWVVATPHGQGDNKSVSFRARSDGQNGRGGYGVELLTPPRSIRRSRTDDSALTGMTGMTDFSYGEVAAGGSQLDFRGRSRSGATLGSSGSASIMLPPSPVPVMSSPRFSPGSPGSLPSEEGVEVAHSYDHLHRGRRPLGRGADDDDDDDDASEFMPNTRALLDDELSSTFGDSVMTGIHSEDSQGVGGWPRVITPVAEAGGGGTSDGLFLATDGGALRREQHSAQQRQQPTAPSPASVFEKFAPATVPAFDSNGATANSRANASNHHRPTSAKTSFFRSRTRSSIKSEAPFDEDIPFDEAPPPPRAQRRQPPLQLSGFRGGGGVGAISSMLDDDSDVESESSADSSKVLEDLDNLSRFMKERKQSRTGQNGGGAGANYFPPPPPPPGPPPSSSPRPLRVLSPPSAGRHSFMRKSSREGRTSAFSAPSNNRR